MDKIINGKRICDENNFYNILSIFLRYYFLGDDNINIVNLIRNVTKTENEFHVFIVYKNYAIDLFNIERENIENMKLDTTEMVYYLINEIKTRYDNNKKILEPYIKTLNDNKSEILEQYNMIKNQFRIEEQEIKKLMKLKNTIELLNISKEYENKANKLREEALNNLLEYYTNMSKEIRIHNKLLKY